MLLALGRNLALVVSQQDGTVANHGLRPRAHEATALPIGEYVQAVIKRPGRLASARWQLPVKLTIARDANSYAGGGRV